MLILIEVIMLISGILAVATGKLPSFLFGGPNYIYEGNRVRLLGLILIIPLPAIFFLALILGFLFGEEGAAFIIIFEPLVVVAAGIAVLIIGRFVRKPAIPEIDSNEGAPVNSAAIEAEISHKAQGSLIYALLGIFGFTAIVVGPLAYIRAGQALRLIDQHQVGEKHRNTAKLARILAVVIFLFYLALAVFFLVFILVY